MQVNSTNLQNIFNYSSVSGASPFRAPDRPVTEVTRHNEEEQDIASPQVNPAIEAKLEKMRTLQFAFSKAEETARALVPMFEPIV